MKQFFCVALCLLASAAVSEDSLSFDEIALSDVSAVAVGKIDSYAGADERAGLHQVWLYTEADCGQISWRLGGQTHSEALSCGETTAFMHVPSGVHHTTIEGCGKRIGAYLTVVRDMHLVIRTEDLGAKERCREDERLTVDYGCGVELVESRKRISLIRGL